MRGGLIGKRGSRLRSSATDKTVEWPERGVTRLAKVPALQPHDDRRPEFRLVPELDVRGRRAPAGLHPPRCALSTSSRQRNNITQTMQRQSSLVILNRLHLSSTAHVPVPLAEALRRRGETRRVSAYVGYRSDLYATSTDSQKSWHGPTRAGTCT